MFSDKVRSYSQALQEATVHLVFGFIHLNKVQQVWPSYKTRILYIYTVCTFLNPLYLPGLHTSI